jgi:hypothetical protein
MEVLSGILLQEMGKTKELSGVPAGAQTGNLLNNIPKIYRYRYLLLRPPMISKI